MNNLLYWRCLHSCNFVTIVCQILKGKDEYFRANAALEYITFPPDSVFCLLLGHSRKTGQGMSEVGSLLESPLSSLGIETEWFAQVQEVKGTL